MPLVETSPHQTKTQFDMPDAWLEDKHPQGEPAAAMWTDFLNYVTDPTHIVVSSASFQKASVVYGGQLFGGNQNIHRSGRIESTDDLRDRLSNANDHFRRKAAEVLGDNDAVLFLSHIYQESSITLSDFDACQHGISLAKLTAANFCEIGANFIYITEAGQGFIESVDQK